MTPHNRQIDHAHSMAQKGFFRIVLVRLDVSDSCHILTRAPKLLHRLPRDRSLRFGATKVPSCDSGFCDDNSYGILYYPISLW
jgi:hypothetical protein